MHDKSNTGAAAANLHRPLLPHPLLFTTSSAPPSPPIMDCSSPRPYLEISPFPGPVPLLLGFEARNSAAASHACGACDRLRHDQASAGRSGISAFPPCRSACLTQTLFCDFLPLPQLHFNRERLDNLLSGNSANFFSYRVRPFAPEMPSLLSIISYSNFSSETDGLTAHVTSTSA